MKHISCRASLWIFCEFRVVFARLLSFGRKLRRQQLSFDVGVLRFSDGKTQASGPVSRDKRVLRIAVRVTHSTNLLKTQYQPG